MEEQDYWVKWERMALEAGMDPADIYTRRDLEKRFREAAGNLIEAVERAAVLMCLALEGAEIERAAEVAGCSEHPYGTRLEEFRLEMRRSALFLQEVS